jgi:hypothetical protein
MAKRKAKDVVPAIKADVPDTPADATDATASGDGDQGEAPVSGEMYGSLEGSTCSIIRKDAGQLRDRQPGPPAGQAAAHRSDEVPAPGPGPTTDFLHAHRKKPIPARAVKRKK